MEKQSKEQRSVDTLAGLLSYLRTPVDGWDLLLVGDGSGSKWNNPGGWACAMIIQNRKTKEINYLTPLVGAVSRGSINWLEAMPYWHCLRHHYYDMQGKEMCANGGVDVLIVSDSKWTVDTMSGRNSAKVHEDMALLFQHYRQKGYRLHWRHVEREIIKLNSIVDVLAANAREYIDAMEYPIISEEFPK